MSGLTFGIKASQQHASIDHLRAIWRLTDDAGYDSCWAFDHFVPMGRTRAGDIFEAWTILAAMAEATRRIRIGTLVSGNIYRHPAMLAKMAVTVDHLSAGRLCVGLGAGGDEYADTMLGLPAYPPRERIARLGESCAVLKRLWSEDEVTFTGQFYQLRGALADPKPVQRPYPPLWIGSSGERYGLRVVAEHADVWVNASLNPDDVTELVRLSGVLDRHCADIGRDPATIRRAVQFRMPADDASTRRAVDIYVRAGFQDILFMPYDGDLARIEATAALLPALR
jgi:alkanesulfonate monooxygenase SsuD/methylene tetrahydromethanopterin reductase-like flavin-dependent oxidoreductase (luciferase family)